MSRAIERITDWWRAESPQHALWAVVCFAAGIAAYYAAPHEPSWPLRLAPLVLALILLVPRTTRIGGVALLLVAFGLNWASYRTHTMEHTPLLEALEPRPVIGHVSALERTDKGVRITLSHARIPDWPAEQTPQNIRLTVRLGQNQPELPHIGESVFMMAGVLPPMGAALPNGFDFARYFYFREIGAVGYGLPPWHIRDRESAPTWRDRFWDWRARLTEKILAALDKETAGVAAGLITGDGRAIPEADVEALRASNLYHIIAISGEHMVIIAGVIFVSLRMLALVALPVRYVYRPQVKMAAAAITLLLVTLYLFVTGLPISAVRAYGMILLVLLAIMLGRRVNALRSLAVTALAMLLLNPADLLEPGFRLSFAATLAILAVVDIRRGTKIHSETWLGRALHLLGTAVLISTVAELATAPWVMSMFNMFSPYGIPSNLFAGLLVSLFLMPCVALYFILLPLGLESGALWLLDLGIRGLMGIAHLVHRLPHSQLFVPSLPSYGLALVALGLLWMCLWRQRVRYWGIGVMAFGMLTVFIPTSPDLLLTQNLKQIAFRTQEGHVQARGRRGTMIAELWANGLGYRELPRASDAVWQCMDKKHDCAVLVNDVVIAFPEGDAGRTEACAKASIIITAKPITPCARADITYVSTESRSGITALWLRPNTAPRIESSADWQGNRPWAVQQAVEED